MGVFGPFHLTKGSDVMCGVFGEVLSQSPYRSPPMMRTWCGRVLVNVARALQTSACASSDCGRWHDINAALAPVSSVSSTAQVLLLGQPSGSERVCTMEDQGASFLYASHVPPPACVRWAGVRASGKVSGVEGALAGW